MPITRYPGVRITKKRRAAKLSPPNPLVHSSIELDIIDAFSFLNKVATDPSIEIINDAQEKYQLINDSFLKPVFNNNFNTDQIKALFDSLNDPNTVTEDVYINLCNQILDYTRAYIEGING